MSNSNQHMYADFKSAWVAKCGKWPSLANFANAEKIFSPGNNNAMALAMQLRDGGHTRKQQKVVMAAAYNDIDTAVEAGFLRRPTKPLKSVECPITGRKVRVYKAIFVKAKRVKAKATKAKAKATTTRKAKAKGVTKAKATKATTPATTPATPAK